MAHGIIPTKDIINWTKNNSNWYNRAIHATHHILKSKKNS